MGTYRIFTGDDDKTTREEIDLAEVKSWTEGMGADEIHFATRQPGVLNNWHPAPQRQFVVILSGRLEIGFEDGSKKEFGPGDGRLVEDTIGKGHTTMALGNEPCITTIIRLQPISESRHSPSEMRADRISRGP